MTTDTVYRDSMQKTWDGMSQQSEAERAEALQVIGTEGSAVITRYDVAHAPDSSDAEYVNACLSLLSLEATARLGVMSSAGETNAEAAERLIGGVGGALDAAVECFQRRDMDGAQQFIEAATTTLSL